jgi:hypothetical protein
MQCQHGVTGLLVDVLATDFSSSSSAWLLAIGGLVNVVATGLLVVVVLATGLLVAVLATGLLVVFVPNKLTPSSAAVKSKNNAFGLPVEGADVMSVSGATVDKVEGGLTEGSNVVIA